MDSASPIRTSSRQSAVGDDYQGRDDYQGNGDDYQGTGDDVQGHGLGEPDKNVKSATRPSATKTTRASGDDYQGNATTTRARGDVEGHGFVNPAPPADFSKPGPSSGGESVHNHEDADASD